MSTILWMNTETRMNSPTLIDLQRRAAQLGPGLHGRRRTADEAERAELCLAFRQAGLAAPEYLDRETTWVERRAKLFEAGDFPDKGVTITLDTLRTLEKRFDLPVPVLIEHADSPLELGYLIEVEAVGSELFGTIALTAEANALVEKSGAQALSLGLSPELDAIREVSLVRNPRVSDAKLFFAGPLEPSQDWQSRYEKLQDQLRQETAERDAESLLKQGRLTPAQLPFAIALLQADDTVPFGCERAPVGRLLRRLLEARPASPLFGEIAPGPAQDHSATLMLPEEVDFYRRHFPDVSLEQIAAKRG